VSENTTRTPATGARHWAFQALAVQGACNASGVAFSLANLMHALCDSPDNNGTDWRNGHPLVYLYACQLAHLTGFASLADDPCRYTWATAWANSEPETFAYEPYRKRNVA
jgi:hypothetical protein